jgi:hypothetical protein
MKKLIFILGFFLLILTLSSTTSCSPKVGCELNESMAPPTNRRGELKTKRGNSNLFDKKTRKRMGYN